MSAVIAFTQRLPQTAEEVVEIYHPHRFPSPRNFPRPAARTGQDLEVCGGDPSGPHPRHHIYPYISFQSSSKPTQLASHPTLKVAFAQGHNLPRVTGHSEQNSESCVMWNAHIKATHDPWSKQWWFIQHLATQQCPIPKHQNPTSASPILNEPRLDLDMNPYPTPARCCGFTWPTALSIHTHTCWFSPLSEPTLTWEINLHSHHQQILCPSFGTLPLRNVADLAQPVQTHPQIPKYDHLYQHQESTLQILSQGKTG